MDEIAVNATEIRSKAVLHHLPCKIGHDGAARVSTFWTPEKQTDGTWVGYFRGRQLAGTEVILPEGVVGIVAHETAASIVTPVKVEQQAKIPYLDDLIDDDDDEEGGYAGFGGGFAELGGDDEDFGGLDAPAAGVSKAGAGAGADRRKRSRDDAEDRANAAWASDTRRNWAVDGSFNSLTFWLHDRMAAEGDVVPAALDWIQAARALHAQVTEDDVQLLGKASA